MKSYNEQLALARRWDKCVDAGSPITAQSRANLVFRSRPTTHTKPRKFGVQVKTYNPHKGEYEWLWMHPTGGPRYEWDSSNEAHRMKEMCYPQTTVEWVRVAEITEE